jgi:putative flippase GtrA
MTSQSSDRNRPLLYLAGGVLSAAVDIGTLQALIACGVPTLVATTVAFVTGLVVNYGWHARVTFSQQGKAASFARYLCVVALTYAMTLGLVAGFEHAFGSPLAGKLVALPLTAVAGYLLGKWWIYR